MASANGEPDTTARAPLSPLDGSPAHPIEPTLFGGPTAQPRDEPSHRIPGEESPEAEAVRIRQLSWLEAAAAAARLGYYRRCLRTRTFLWSRQIYDDYGVPYDTGPLTEDRVLHMILPEDRASVRHVWSRLVADGRPRTYRFRIRRSDGTVRWREAIGKVETGPDGEAIAELGVSRDVTAEMEASERMQRLQGLLAHVSRLAGLGFGRRDLATDRAEWSGAIYAHYGFPSDRDPPTAAELRARIAPEDWPAWDELHQRTLSTGQMQTGTFRVNHPQRGLRVIRLVTGVEPSEDGGRRLFGVTQDVTEEHLAAERLREVERLFAEAAHAAGLGVWRRSLGDGTALWDELTYRHYGLTPRAIPPTREELLARVHPEDRELWREAWETLFASRRPVSFRFRTLHDDGSVRWLRLTAGVRRDPETGADMAFGTTQDITEQVVAFGRLQRQERLLAEAARLAALGFWMERPANGALEASPELQRLLGRPAASSQAILDGIAVEDREKWRAARELAMATGQSHPIELRFVRPDGTERIVQCVMRVDRVDDEAVVFGVVQDITDPVAQRQRLAESSHLAALGQLTAGVAHVVNNLLATIALNLDLLRDERLSAEAGAAAEAIARAIRAGAEFTERLLVFAQRRPGAPVFLSLRTVVAELVHVLGPLLGPDVRTIVEGEPEVPLVRADRALLDAALANLVLNARDAMPTGGELRLRVYRSDARGRAAREGAFAAVAVSDTGVGMSAEAMARAVEPFFTTRAREGRAGLGLSFVFGFARRAGGNVLIDSAPGEGTTVAIVLPVCCSPDDPSPASPV